MAEYPSNDTTNILIRRLLYEYIRPYRGKFLSAACFMAIVAMTTGAYALVIQPMLDKVFIAKDYRMLITISVLVSTLAIIRAGCSLMQGIQMRFIGQRIVTDMQFQLYQHLIRADLALLARERSGRIISRFANDINILRKSVSIVVTGFVKESLTLIILIGVMVYQSPVLSAITLIVFPLTVYPVLRLGKRMRKISWQTQNKLGEFTERLDETFQGIRVIKAYGQEAFEVSRTEKVLERIFTLYIKAARTDIGVSAITEMLGGFAVAIVVWYGGSQVMAGANTPGALFSFIGAVMLAYKPAKTLSNLNISLQEGLAAAKRLFTLLDEKPAITEHSNAMALKVKKGMIGFHNVSFSYQGTKSVLENISFSVQKGQIVALVGPSGSGKSTIMNVLLRFYDPQQGKITIDDHDIRQVSLASLRENIAFVGQHVTLFDESIAANIAYGRRDASEHEIRQAAMMAAADSFINELPQGYDTLVGKGGFTLSGGQRQRLAIARAILRNAPILLLDEATSALDPYSEKQVQKALQNLMAGRSTIVIAHRLSTVINADVIHVMREGTIIESGTHQELLDKKGEYNKLYLSLEQ